MLLPIDSSISSFTVATLPNPAALPTGTSFAVTDYGGNIATAVGGVWRFEFPFRTTWANRPPVNLVPVGAELQATDYNNQTWVSDGTVWRPAQGRARIRGGNGNPLASISGIASGLFTLPPIVIPVGMFFDGATIRAEMMLKKTTSTATWSGIAYIGPLGTTSDPNFGIVSNSAPANACTRLSSIAVITTDSIMGSRYTGPHGVDNGAAAVAAVSMAADLKVSLGVAFANVADTFQLQSYLVTLEA